MENNTIENIDDLKNIPKIIEKLIETELWERAIWLKELQDLKYNHLDIIKKLEKENKWLKESHKQKNELLGVFNLLAKDWIITIKEDWEMNWDEYGNSWWFHRIQYIYKEKVIYEDAEIF